MKTRNIQAFFGLTLVLCLIPAGNLAADRSGGPVDFIRSPTSAATDGLFSADLDNYISAARYTDVEMRKEFVFVYFDQDKFGTFGYGRKFGSLYLAAYVGGNLFQGFYAPAVQEREYISDDSSGRMKFKNIITGKPEISDDGTYNNNRFALFVGTGGMGFRLSYASTLGRFNEKEITYDDGGTRGYAKNFKTALGWIVPEIQWGLTRPLSEKGIRPLVTFDLGFFRNFERFESRGPLDFTAENERVSYSENFIQPSLTMGLGGFTFFTKPGFYTDVDFDYTFTMKIYNNDYSYTDGGGNFQTASVKGLNGAGRPLTQNSYMENIIAPSVGLTYTGMTRVDLKASLFLPVAFVSARETELSMSMGNLLNDGIDTSLFYFQFTPKIVFGFTFQAVPDRLDLNIGGIIQFSSIVKTSYSEDSFTNGASTPGASTVITKMILYGEDNLLGETVGTNQNAALNLGIVFRFNEYVVMDAMTGLNGGGAFNLFGAGAGSLTSYSSILLTLKI